MMERVTIQNKDLKNETLTVSRLISPNGKLALDKDGKCEIEPNKAKLLLGIPGFVLIEGEIPADLEAAKPEVEEVDEAPAPGKAVSGIPDDEDYYDEPEKAVEEKASEIEEKEPAVPNKEWTISEIKAYLDIKEIIYKTNATKNELLQLALG